MKLGLCFSGGGARGAYQIGVCQALKELGILDKVEAISGTSIGAVNAALVACMPVEKIRDLWFSIPHEVLSTSESFFKRLIHERIDFFKNGIYSINALRKIIKENIDYDLIRAKKVFVTLSDCGAKDGGLTSLIKASYLHYIRKNKLVVYSPLWKQSNKQITKQIIASCSIPVAFPAENIDGKQYYDGGLYDNIPVKPLIDAGCDTIIVIQVAILPYFYKYRYKTTTFHTVKSSRSLGLVLKFNPEQSKIRYDMGYEDGLKFFKTNPIF